MQLERDDVAEIGLGNRHLLAPVDDAATACASAGRAPSHPALPLPEKARQKRSEARPDTLERGERAKQRREQRRAGQGDSLMRRCAGAYRARQRCGKRLTSCWHRSTSCLAHCPESRGDVLLSVRHLKMKPMTDEFEATRKRLFYRAHHRGTKEMDLVLGPFAEAHLAGFDAKKLERFEAVLEESDADSCELDHRADRRCRPDADRRPDRRDHRVRQMRVWRDDARPLPNSATIVNVPDGMQPFVLARLVEERLKAAPDGPVALVFVARDGRRLQRMADMLPSAAARPPGPDAAGLGLPALRPRLAQRRHHRGADDGARRADRAGDQGRHRADRGQRAGAEAAAARRRRRHVVFGSGRGRWSTATG